MATGSADREFIRQLTEQLTESARRLNAAMQRIHLTELTYREYLQRLQNIERKLGEMMKLLQTHSTARPERRGSPTAWQPRPARTRRKHRYADYIEFSNYAELKKFEEMDPVSQRDLEVCDPDELMRRLLEEPKG